MREEKEKDGDAFYIKRKKRRRKKACLL